MVEYLELTIDELLLDEENPRLGPVKSQSEALDALLKLNQSHFRNLMLSIKRNGLDPGDSLYVIEGNDPEDFVVLDGNRRLSALKILTQPDLLDGTEASTSTKKSLVRAAEGFDRNNVEPIRCVKFEDRASADDWIYRRHTGDMDGEGRIQWGRTEIQRFTGDRSVLDVIDFVGRNADYTDDEWEQTKETIESRKSSNIGRLLESAAGKKHLGISVSSDGDGKTPLLSAQPEWALGVLKRIIEDVRDGVVDSRSHNTASDIEVYFKSLPVELQPLKGKRPTPKPFRDINLKATPAASVHSSRTKPKSKTAPRTRLTLAPKKLSFFAPPSEKGKQLLREATAIDVKKLPVSSAAVLRAFIELSIEDYMDRQGLSKMGTNKEGKLFDLSLSQKAEAVMQDMTKNKIASSSDLREFRKGVADKKAPSSIQSLHGFVHNKYAMPTPEGIRAGWDCSIPVFEATYGKV